MAQSRASKKFMNMAYGLGAAIVIIGALFKITNFELGPLNGKRDVNFRSCNRSNYFRYISI